MKAIVLIRKEIDIEGEVGRYSQLPKAEDCKGKQYKVSMNEGHNKRGIYFSQSGHWYPRPDMYFNDELKEILFNY